MDIFKHIGTVGVGWTLLTMSIGGLRFWSYWSDWFCCQSCRFL